MSPLSAIFGISYRKSLRDFDFDLHILTISQSQFVETIIIIIYFILFKHVFF